MNNNKLSLILKAMAFLVVALVSIEPTCGQNRLSGMVGPDGQGVVNFDDENDRFVGNQSVEPGDRPTAPWEMGARESSGVGSTSSDRGDRYSRYADAVIKQFDKDGNDTHDPVEMKKFPRAFPKNADTNGVGALSRAELAAYYRHQSPQNFEGNVLLGETLEELKRSLQTAKEDSARQLVLTQIDTVLSKQYDAFLHRNELELRQMEDSVMALRNQLERRKNAKEELVDLELQRISNEATGLVWPDEDPKKVKITGLDQNGNLITLNGGMVEYREEEVGQGRPDDDFAPAVGEARMQTTNGFDRSQFQRSPWERTRIADIARDRQPEGRSSRSSDSRRPIASGLRGNAGPSSSGFAPRTNSRIALSEPAREQLLREQLLMEQQLREQLLNLELQRGPRDFSATNSARTSSLPAGVAKNDPTHSQLRQIALSALNYESAHQHFPGNIRDGNGEPLLSWRVAILQFMPEEQQALYKKFKLDEPWDSEHNIQLLNEMPDVYKSLNFDSATKTVYLGFDGEGTIFESGKTVGMSDISDGTSNTIFAAQMNRQSAIEWTKPADIKFTPGTPVTQLAETATGTITICTCDGGLPRVSLSDLDSDRLELLIQRNDHREIAPIFQDR